MIELAYTSTATWSYSDDDLREILSKSRANNRKAGITGILLYRGQTVLQVLEGDADVVHALYAKLLVDPRHHSLTLLYDRPLKQRAFGHWAMAFEVRAESEAFGEDVYQITADGIAPALEADHRSQRLLDAFVRLVR